MLKFIGVTELQRRFRLVFDEVVQLRLQAAQANDAAAQFDRVWERLARLNADVDEAELAAGIEAARSE